MPLAPLTHSPRTVTLAAAANTVAPYWLRTDPFRGGNLINAAGAANAILVGASVNRTEGKYLKFNVASADVTPAAGVIGQVAAARVSGDVTGDLTISFGTTAGEIIDEIRDCADVTDADLNLTTIVLVNGKPYARINDAAAPNPGPGVWGSDSDNGYTIVIGASTGTDAIAAGTEIEVFIGLNIGKCAKRSAAGLLVDGTALAAGVHEERYLGVAVAGTDSFGRTTSQLVISDFVMAEAAAMSMLAVSK